MIRVRCGSCSRFLEEGSLRYVLMWKLFADYDGIINLKDEGRIQESLEAIEAASRSDLEEQIYMESRHILCPACREEILDTLASLEVQDRDPEPEEENGSGERNLH